MLKPLLPLHRSRAIHRLVLACALAPLAAAASACGSSTATIDDGATDGGGASNDATTTRADDGGANGNGNGDGDGTGSGTGSANGGGEGGTGACGACAPGFACSPSGACKNAAGVPQFGNVYLLLMENHSRGTIAASADAKYIQSLMKDNAQAIAYQDTKVHPSLPNYVGLTSGDTQGITCDCYPTGQSNTCSNTCGPLTSGCNCNKNVDNLADQIEKKGRTWHAYADGASGPCDTQNHDKYATRHVPFLYYDAIRNDKARCANIVPFTQLAADLGKYDFMYVAPDLCHDMHDSCAPTNNQIAQGDAWLKDNVHVITDGAKFKKDGVLFIVWDEGDEKLGGLAGNDDNVALIVISPFAQPGAQSSAAYDHYSLLATIEDGLGLPRLGKAAQAKPITDVWR